MDPRCKGRKGGCRLNPKEEEEEGEGRGRRTKLVGEEVVVGCSSKETRQSGDTEQEGVGG